MSNYWQKRLQKQQDILYNKAQAELEEELVRLYREAFQGIQVDAEVLWSEIAEQGKAQVNNLYRYNRYYQLMNNLNQILSTLGEREVKITENKLLQLYSSTGLTLESVEGISFALVNTDTAQKVIDSIWCADGLHWSDRVWRNKQALQQLIEKGLIDCVARGVSKDEMVKTIMKNFGTGFAQADRIARTELTHVQNQAAKDTYEANGYTQYEFLAAMDERTSDICKELNGKIFNFTDAVVGENFPPCHPNCRSTIVAVRKEKNNVKN